MASRHQTNVDRIKPSPRHTERALHARDRRWPVRTYQSSSDFLSARPRAHNRVVFASEVADRRDNTHALRVRSRPSSIREDKDQRQNSCLLAPHRPQRQANCSFPADVRRMRKMGKDSRFSQQAESRMIVPFCSAPHVAAEHRDREVPAMLHHGFLASAFLYASRDPTRTQ